MKRPLTILLGLLLIAAGIVCFVLRIKDGATMPGAMPIVVSSIGVVGVLAGVAVIRRALRRSTRP